MAKASVAQACGAACIEAYCNKLQLELKQKAEELVNKWNASKAIKDFETADILRNEIMSRKIEL